MAVPTTPRKKKRQRTLSHRGGDRPSCPEADLEAERSAPGFLPEELFDKAPRGHLSKCLRLPVCQNDYACLEGWSQHDRSAETRILAVMINQVHAANVSSEPAKRIVQVLGTSARPPVHPYVDLWAM